MAAGGGFLNLAYMAELAVVVNLAYLELKSLRYIQKAKDSVSEVLHKLNDVRKNGDAVVGLEQFMDLHSQAKNLFNDDDKELRRGAWYLVNADATRMWHPKCAVTLYAAFQNGKDKAITTSLLAVSVLTILIITILSRLPSFDITHPVADNALWWSLFIILFLAIAVPTCLVLMGRHLSLVASKISQDIENRKDSLAISIVSSKLDATNQQQAAASI